MTDSLGDAAQVRMIVEQALEAAIIKFEGDGARTNAAEIPPLIKWLVGSIAALGFAALIGGGTWLVTSVSTMQITLARMDERMAAGSVKDARVDDLSRRVVQLEAYHSGGGR